MPGREIKMIKYAIHAKKVGKSLAGKRDSNTQRRWNELNKGTYKEKDYNKEIYKIEESTEREWGKWYRDFNTREIWKNMKEEKLGNNKQAYQIVHRELMAVKNQGHRELKKRRRTCRGRWNGEGRDEISTKDVIKEISMVTL